MTGQESDMLVTGLGTEQRVVKQSTTPGNEQVVKTSTGALGQNRRARHMGRGPASTVPSLPPDCYARMRHTYSLRASISLVSNESTVAVAGPVLVVADTPLVGQFVYRLQLTVTAVQRVSDGISIIKTLTRQQLTPNHDTILRLPVQQQG